jgi:predicted AlkP superfamily pyrophosphatase or phosphodiesterase
MNMIRSRLPFVLALILVGLARPVWTEPRPDPAVTRALIVSVDGLRPDLIARAAAPEMQRLLREGA